MLYPRETRTRECKDLSGIWHFQADPDGHGRSFKWFSKGLPCPILMPVPSSYNEITTDPQLRDYIGDVWYERYFYVPKDWSDRRVMLRFGSVTHSGTVWVNGEEIVRNKGGFLPFEADITNVVYYGQLNHLVVCVNNELSWEMLPPGEVSFHQDADGVSRKDLHQQHDFFNYSGIHRPVYLYTTPMTYIEDVTIKTSFEGHTGFVDYQVCISQQNPSFLSDSIVKVFLYDASGNKVAEGKGEIGKIKVQDVQLWNPGDAYLYRMSVCLYDEQHVEVDHYELNIGIRTVKVEGNSFLINGRPFYFRGFGKHEDMDIKGKGFDHALILRDFYLMEWIGANSFRTSHYPYAEEVLDIADRQGIVVISEVPAVGMLSKAVPAMGELEDVFHQEKINDKTLEHHIRVTRDMIRRDKNHPCVVMWSLANEASTMEENAEPYFRKLVDETRKLDDRPLMIVNLMLIEPKKCRVSKLFDVIGLNTYFGWYSEMANLKAASARLEQFLEDWHRTLGKPLMITEYGVDTIQGLHRQPPVMYSEEYQVSFFQAYHQVFDRLGYLKGEHVWNFADFMTKEDLVRIDGNRKGVFTRQRQPKMSAYTLKERWTAPAEISQESDGHGGRR
ncbi:beta-glucuronidase [Caldalkalibacillus uzonensis]|uniref:Beta-glucuronidase n=1 Tax=Caldalkalibacillus uzonensis TaxID=353224 RepID=A0ABU0CPE2_9BACI|nr:beta-glucuronidase [Caldalkalibacillus uzonensis]MDQ0338264.1 beta-glucuronidase [Caldalkalibacillus uzonensis]